jgi:hypothetical protein
LTTNDGVAETNPDQPANNLACPPPAGNMILDERRVVAIFATFQKTVSKAHEPKFEPVTNALKQLSGEKVYKSGEVDKEVFVVGKTDDGKLAGVKPSVVESSQFARRKGIK